MIRPKLKSGQNYQQVSAPVHNIPEIIPKNGFLKHKLNKAFFIFLLIFQNGTEYHQKGYLDLTNFDLLFSSEF